MIAELNGGTARYLPFKQLSQQTLALFQRNFGEIPAVEMEDVEGIEDELAIGPG